MRKMILAVIVALLAGCCGTCFGRKLADPEKLTFKKTYSIPGMTRDELYRNTAGWHSESLNLSFGGVVCKDEDKGYRARYYNQRFGNKQGALFGTVFLSFRDGSFDLTFTDISAFYGNKDVDPVSTCDDRFNRTWYWRATHNAKLIDEIRKRSKEIFEMITASMDEYLKVGPPVELKKL